jgi:hypothetical protein
MEKVEALGVTFEEIKERTGLSKDFVISAVVNGSFPGSYKITECGIDVSTLIRWEKDPRIVKSGYHEIISQVYHYPTDYIFFGHNTS